jgi:hypothetical protein
MSRNIGRFRNTRACVSLAGGLLLAGLGALSVVSPAMATPKGEFAVFGDCPTSTPGVVACMYAKTESGELAIGSKSVPIVNPIVIQGGLREKTGTELEFVAAKDGNTLVRAPQNVPGGLLGLGNCTAIKGDGLRERLKRSACKAIFESRLTGVTATTELAAPASAIKLSVANLFHAEGVVLQLPVKVHLENPLLGSSCYLGSNASPIVISFTDGITSPPLPNKPIKGKLGEPEALEGGEILELRENSLVDNAFAAPATNGCGGIFEFLIGPIVNSALGVPSPAGQNTAILNGSLEQANAANVQAHE